MSPLPHPHGLSGITCGSVSFIVVVSPEYQDIWAIFWAFSISISVCLQYMDSQVNSLFFSVPMWLTCS